MKRFDHTFAPPGYRAEKEIVPGRCFGCGFFPALGCFAPDCPCTPDMRPDGQGAIFVDDRLNVIAPIGTRHDGSGWAYWDP